MIKKILSIFQDSLKSFEGQEPGESVALLLRKHPFYVILKVCFLALLCAAPIAAGIVYFPILEARGLRGVFLFGSGLWCLFIWLGIFYSLAMYTLNTVIITDRRIIENEQHGLFSRKVSELHTYRVQDVSVDTHGLIETFLKFGDVAVQTAGTERNFVFHQMPHPERVKDGIMRVVHSRRSRQV